jgi:inhibitor of cysteine peptidase
MKNGQIRTALGLAMVLVVTAAVAVGCFAASGSWSAEPAGGEVVTPVEWKPEPSLAGGLQLFSSYQELKDFLKTVPSYPGYWYWGAGRGELMLDGAMTYSAAENAPGYSQTNIQVEGVDEADIVKSDGEYIYVATDNRLIIARAYPPQKARILHEIEIEGTIEGLFVNGDRLVVLEGNGPAYGIWREYSSSYSYEVKARLKVYDVSDREAPVLQRDLSIDGHYVSSRMIGNYVYLIASGSAWIGEDNVTLPRIYGNNGAIEIQPAEIWHSETPDNGYGFTTIMSVNIANDDEDPVHETLLLGIASTIYVSPSNIYVTFPDWSSGSGKTSIHRIHIDEGHIEYHATGEVPGSLLNQFSMDEQGEYFRVATTAWNASTFGAQQINNVYILDQKLDIYGRLENLAPGEQIYSARFMGNRCYLVTFEVIDPLFVIDLASPGNPRVLGELKIPGYSGYLHPYDENHLIGIGMLDSTVKIALFDVTDTGNPEEISTYLVNDNDSHSMRDWIWSSTPVLYEHKAFLFDRDRGLLVLPVSIEGGMHTAAPDRFYDRSSWQGAYVFDISLESGLELRGKITHCDGNESEKSLYGGYYGYSTCSIKRSLYIGDVLYTISGGKIGMNDLETLEEIGEISLS